MLSMLNGTLSLDAVSVPENALGPAFIGFSGNNAPFSDIMAGIQKDGALPTELPDTAKALENLPIPPKLLELLKQLNSDGNKLPEEATAVLEDLKLQLKTLFQEILWVKFGI